MEPVRVLHFPGVFTSGGVESVLMNWYRNIDRSKIQFDFCVARSGHQPIDDEVEFLGGRVIYMPRIRNTGILRTIKGVKQIIKDNGPYKAVHIHSVHAGVVPLLAASLAGIEKRIYHVHSTQDLALSKIPGKRIFEIISNFIICKKSSCRYACSRDAGKYIYGQSKYEVINNAIDLNRFYPWSQEKWNLQRSFFNFNPDDLVVGYVARFVEGKNHELLVDLAEEAKKQNIKLKILLVGDGPNKKKIEEIIKNRGLSLFFEMPGFIKEVEKVYNSLNIFCVPSLFEGLSIVTIEAQACGLPCLISSGVPKEVNLGITKVIQEDIDSDAAKWLDALLALRNQRIDKADSIRQRIVQLGYEISDIVKKLELNYLMN